MLTFVWGFGASIIWTLVLALDADIAPVAALLMGIGMIPTATVATVGMVVVGGRWARRLGLTGLGMTVVTALITSVGPLWVVGLGLTSIGAGAMFLPSTLSRIRKLPAATGPPWRAVAVPLLLVTAPFAYGVAAGGSHAWALALAGIGAPLTAFAYARVIPGGLLALRIGWPALALGVAPVLAPPAGITSAVLGVATAALAWHPSVKAAFSPPRETGSSYSIPPELAPSEILEAADIDERGRRR